MLQKGQLLENLYEHYKSLNQYSEFSKNVESTNIISLSYSQYRAICTLCEVRLTEHKIEGYNLLPEISKIVGTDNIVIRIGKKSPTDEKPDGYFEVFDLMLLHTTREQALDVEKLLQARGMLEKGYEVKFFTFIMPDEQSVYATFIQWIPPTEDKDTFFGYLL